MGAPLTAGSTILGIPVTVLGGVAAVAGAAGSLVGGSGAMGGVVSSFVGTMSSFVQTVSMGAIGADCMPWGPFGDAVVFACKGLVWQISG